MKEWFSKLIVLTVILFPFTVFSHMNQECGPCVGKVTELTLQYLGASSVFIEVLQKKDQKLVFQGTVEPNDNFNFSGKDEFCTLGNEILIYVDDYLNTSIHTSCSHPIGPGLIIGDFKVVKGFSREGGLLCPIVNCDDQNVCTDDFYDSILGCQYDNNNMSCDDGMFCNGSDTCNEGSCSLHEGNPCLEICNEEEDVCEISTTTTSILPPPPTTTTSAPTTSSSTTTTAPVSPPPYSISIVPGAVTLSSGESLQFSAQTFTDSMTVPLPLEDCDYQWELVSPSGIGSIIGPDGLFTAGLNETLLLVRETIRVFDTAHANISTETIATILVQYTSSTNLLPPGALSSSYRMVSVPFWPANGDPLYMLTGTTDYNPYRIRLFRWDGSIEDGQGGYAEYPGIPKLNPGISIWAVSLSEESIQLDGTPTDTTRNFSITIPPGWSQIGNPFPFVVNWDQVTFSGDQDAVEPPWLFDGFYLLSTILRPWDGYFVYNNSADDVAISIPPSESQISTVGTRSFLSATERGFKLQIGVIAFPFFWLQDNYNFIGTSENSVADRDSKDLHEPPLISTSQLSLYFPHEWDGKEARYTSDFRSVDSPSERFECVWKFTVSGSY